MDTLIGAAKAARERAYTPFSKFKVGAAIEDEHGNIYTGCNVENASYGLTMCAERVAAFKAISEGAGKLLRIVVVADTPMPAPPCGACRQVLWELMGDAQVAMVNLADQRESWMLSAIFPRAFDASYL